MERGFIELVDYPNVVKAATASMVKQQNLMDGILLHLIFPALRCSMLPSD